MANTPMQFPDGLSAASLVLTAPLPVTSGGNGLATATLGDLRYGSGANTLAALAGNTTTTKKFLTQTGNGSVSAAPAWSTIVTADIATALTTPGPIGATTPGTGKFTSVTNTGLTSGRIPIVSTGGLMTDNADLLFGAGILTLGGGTGAKSFIINGAAGNNRTIEYQTAGVKRWQLRVSTTAEGGTDTGSPWVLTAFDDTGATIDSPISIIRAAGGVMTCTRPLQIANGTAGTPGIVFAGSTTTGFFRSAANAISVSIAGVDAGRWNAAGNLLIGTSTDGMTASGSLAVAQDFAHRGTLFGIFSATPVAKKTGYGTPTNAAVQASFDATTITLVNLAKQVAQMVLDNKSYGLYGA